MDTIPVVVSPSENQHLEAYFEYIPQSPVVVNHSITFMDMSTILDGILANWTWDFGDGTYAYGPQTTHAYGAIGDYEITLTITDERGNSDRYSLSLTIQGEEDDEGGSVPGFEITLLLGALPLVFFYLHIHKRKHTK
jgi:PKD repeat protein